MVQALNILLSAIERAVDADPARRAAHDAAKPAAEALAPKLPLVHRTLVPAQPRPWREIFTKGLLETDGVRELEASLGYDRAVYFFAGAGAYPHGLVALLLLPSMLPADETTFTPFDTGAMVKDFLVPAMHSKTSLHWDGEDKRRTLEHHLGRGLDLAAFVSAYLAAHFRDPHTYITHPQESEPDFPAYHGLTSKKADSRDRRAWTIEVHAHTDVSVPADPAALSVLLDNHQLRRDLPAAYLRVARVAREDDEDDTDFTRAIAEEVLRMVRRAKA